MVALYNVAPRATPGQVVASHARNFLVIALAAAIWSSPWPPQFGRRRRRRRACCYQLDPKIVSFGLTVHFVVSRAGVHHVVAKPRILSSPSPASTRSLPAPPWMASFPARRFHDVVAGEGVDGVGIGGTNDAVVAGVLDAGNTFSFSTMSKLAESVTVATCRNLVARPGMLPRWLRSGVQIRRLVCDDAAARHRTLETVSSLPSAVPQRSSGACST